MEKIDTVNKRTNLKNLGLKFQDAQTVANTEFFYSGLFFDPMLFLCWRVLQIAISFSEISLTPYLNFS